MSADSSDSDYESVSESEQGSVQEKETESSSETSSSLLSETSTDEGDSESELEEETPKVVESSNPTVNASTTTTTTTTTTTSAVAISEPDEKKKNKEDVAVDDSEYYGKIRLDDDEMLETDAERVVVSMRNIHKTYLLGIEGVPALRGVTATIYKGEFVCIFGTSGGGKTTMLNIIGTIDRPSKGDIFLCGTHITPRTPDKVLSELRLAKMGFVFQTFNLLSAMTAVENVELPMILRGDMTAKQRRDRAMELLARVGMEKRANHLPSQLSGGEQQRVTIARAMANNPDILLLDEPTGDLDTHNTAIAMKLLTDLHKQGVTLIMVTHDVNLKYFADRVIWMRDGLVQRIEHTTPIQRKDCITRMEAELSRKKKKVSTTAKPEFEVRQPASYEPFAYAMQRAAKNEEEQRRLMISLGLSSPEPKEEEKREEHDEEDEEEKEVVKKEPSSSPKKEKEDRLTTSGKGVKSHSHSHHKSSHHSHHHSHRAQTSDEV